jgi:hypothetical protein
VHRAVVLLLTATLATSACREPPPRAQPAPKKSAVAEVPRIFLTWSREDTAKTLSIRTWSQAPLPQPRLLYDTEAAGGADGSWDHRAKVRARYIPEAERYVAAFELEGLEPARDYHFQLFSGDKAVGPARRFRSLADDDRPLRVAFGGDVDVGDESRATARRVATTDPDVVVLGGDLAYANGALAAVPRWDALFELLESELVRADGTLIPIVFGIGNHEVRWGLKDPRPTDAPFYFALFTDLTDGDKKSETYFARRLGPHAMLFNLDTGHISPWDGKQRRWLERQLKQHKATPWRIASYHVPLYPSVRPFDNGWSKKGREHWLALFDEHRLTVAFENHDHAIKRTVPLRGGRSHPEGTVYLGDGCWGAGARDPDPTRPYLAHAERGHHAWIADFTREGAHFRAVDHAGRVRDELKRGAPEVLPLQGWRASLPPRPEPAAPPPPPPPPTPAAAPPVTDAGATP